MTTTVKESRSCPACGKPMPTGVLAGLCPACLLAQGAASDTGGAATARPFKPLSLREVAALFPQLEILSLLGAGGMGAVYQARQRSLDRFVALKILPATGADAANFAERFNREARALARLSHPSIVAVHEFGQAGGLHYFIMEFVDGANLRQLEKAGRLSPREALQIIPQICDALQYAHDEGVVHRDIKPENVLVDRKGRVKIADFGLAKILGVDAESLRLTLEGQVMGTPHYMAPEQVERPLAVDHRADIYSLGVVFYEMLTGDLPLGKFAPPSRKVEVDVRLDEVVLRALENDPERRYQNASEVKTQVETIAGTPARAAPHEAAVNAEPQAGSIKRKATERCLHWGRFPVVYERDGKRHFSWRGVLPLLFVNFGVLSVAFGIVTVLTGQSMWGWLGVKGWPSVVVRLVLATVFVTMQVRRTMRRPAAETTCVQSLAARLSPRSRWWFQFGQVATFIVLGLVGWLWFQFGWLMPKLKELTGDFPVVQTAARDNRTGAFVAELPGGGRIELLAVGEPDAALHGWWAPDGEPLTNTTYEVRNAAEGSDSRRVSKDLLYHFTDLPEGISQLGWESTPVSGGGSGGQVFRDGTLLTGGVQERHAWNPGARKATIRQGFGIAPWRTIATAGVENQSGSASRLPDDPNWVANFHRPPYGATGDAQVSVVFGPEDRLWTHRVVAVDTNGVVHVPNNGNGTPIEKLTLWTYGWPGLEIRTVKEFRLEVRPVHWVGFPDVALEPTRPVPRPTPAHFGPVTTRTFDELIDFDTGRTASFPPGGTAKNIFDGLAEAIQWARDNGFDAAAGTGELQPLEVDFAVMKNADWDTLSASEVLQRFYQSHYRPPVLKPQSDAPLPATYAFRTRQQGIGLLQIMSFAERRPGATVRFKLVTKADAP